MALNPLDRLVRDMEDVKRQLAGRSQLNHSSLENSSIPVYDGEGAERLRIGAQADGTHSVKYVQGPPPPRPTAPVVSVDGPVVRVRWDGELMGGHIPEDFSRIDVHFALASEDIEDASVVRANLATAAGSEATLMATQTGTYRVGLVAMSQSRARSEMSETVEVEVQVVDLATAIETAAESANGKNTVTYSQRSPEPTDEGAEGDTWWVNEVRPRDPEDPAAGVVIAITEQWQHTGQSWVQVEMAHEVIASVDLGRATVGYLRGERIEAGTIDTEQLAFGAATGDVLAVDALNFKTATGLDISGSSFRAGDAVEITEEFGIRQFGPDGALNVSLPSDGSPAEFRGDLSARTLTATGRMSIQGPGAIASGGVLELESGVVPPVAGPQIGNEWERTTMPPLLDAERASGIAWMEEHWWRAVTTTVAYDAGGRGRIEKITAAGGLVSSFEVDFRTRINGVTAHDGLLYVLGAASSGAIDNRTVIAYSTNGTESHRWEYPNYGTGTYQPGIGTHGSNIVIAQCWATGELSWRIYRPSDGHQISQVDREGNVASDIAGIHLGQFDIGAQKILVGASRASSSRVQMLAYSHSGTPEFESGYSWYAADYAAIRGFAWDGSRFWTLQPDGNLAAYQPLQAGRFVGDNDSDWWCAIAWSADGGHETPAGPATNFRYLRRSRLRRQNGDVPDGVESAEVFYAKTETEPTRADLHWGGSNSSPNLVNNADYINSSWQEARTPSAENTFSTDAPGELRSAIGNFRVDGSGAGEWGPLKFHADGTMTGLPPTMGGTVSITPSNPPVVETVTVTFPSGVYATAPTVVATPVSTALHQVEGVGVWNVTASSFQVGLRRTTGTTTNVAWIATGG